MSFFVLLLSFQIMLAICLVVIILVQHGRGADAGAALSGGSQNMIGGAPSGGSTITRVTAVLAALFILNSVILAAITPQNSSLDSIVIESNEGSSVTTEEDKDVPNIPLPE